MSLQTLQLSIKSYLAHIQAARSYKAQRHYFTSKTQSYLDYLSQAGVLCDVPKEHTQRVLEFWSPVLSLVVACARVRCKSESMSY